MTREQYEAMQAKLTECSYYEPAVIDGIAEQALEGVKELLARVEALEAENAALRARAALALEWEDLPLSEGEDGPAARALPGAFKIRIYCVDGRFTWRIRVPGADLAYCGAVDAPVTLAEAKAQCRATFLRLVGVK